MKLVLLALLVAAVYTAPLPEDDGAVQMIVNGVPEGAALDISDVVDIKLKEHVDGQVVAATNLLHPYTAAGIAEAAAAAAEQNDIPEPVVLPAPAAPEIEVPAPVVLPAPVLLEVVVPQPVVLPSPVAPEVVPEPVVLPSPALPEVVVPQPIVLPAPAVPEYIVPKPVVLPSPALPEVVVPQPVVLPSPAQPESLIPQPIVLPSPATPEVIVPQPVVLPSPAVPEVAPEFEELPSAGHQYSNELYNDGTVQVQLNTQGSAAEPSILGTLQSWVSMVVNYITSSGTQQVDLNQN